ncbi:MAG: hypothetical protein OEQ53_18740, partial [Saprospiraceae bacterium]|nr:hypothetical protein [Saprospiraceae bacterium]
MAAEKTMRLSQVARKLNVGTSTIADHLATKGFEIENKPNTKITLEQFDMLAKEFASSAMDKEEALGLTIGQKHTDNLVIDTETAGGGHKKADEEEIFIKNITTAETVTEEKAKPEPKKPEPAPKSDTKLQGIKVVGKIDLDETKEVEEKKPEKAKEKAPEPKEELPPEEVIKAKAASLKGLTVVGKIELPKETPVASSDDKKERQKKKRPRKRITANKSKGTKTAQQGRKGRVEKEEVSDKEIQEQIKATLAKLSGGKGGGGLSRSKYRREKRSAV